MDSGFGKNLEGFRIKGNLSVIAPEDATYGQVGSLEGSGTLYYNIIQEYNENSGVTLQNVTFKDDIIHIPYTSPSLNKTSASLILDGGVYINTTTNATSFTSGGGLTILGGAGIAKRLIVGDGIDSQMKNIINVADPIDDQDAVTKKYVDDRKLQGNFTTGQVIVADSNGDAIRGYENFVYDGNTLSLLSENNISGSAGGSFISYGGLSVKKDVFIGGTLNVNDNNIINVKDPINLQDAATKKYVDENRLQGNFTTGQLIIAQSDGDAIRGYDNLYFTSINGTKGTLFLNQNTDIKILNTLDTSGLGIGGTFTSLGGASFLKNVYIGGQLDVNLQRITSVADPIEDYDAVNKRYVDALLDVTVGGDNSVLLNNNTAIPVDIEGLTFDTNVKAFVCYIYVNNNYENTSVYTIRGINTGSTWYIVNTYTGDDTNVNFYIRKDTDGKGIVQYTNLNITGFSSIQYRIFTQLFENASGSQINTALINNQNSFIDIPNLTFDNNDVEGAKVILHITNTTTNEHGLVFLNILQKDTTWVLNSHFIGDLENIKFRIQSFDTQGIIQYTNTNSIGSYDIRFRKIQIADVQTPVTFLANTLIPTQTNVTDFTFPRTQTNFNLTMYVEIPGLNKYALYEVEFVSKNDIWKINSRFIGDPLGLSFSVQTTDENHVLKYTNPNAYDAFAKYTLNSPPTFQPLPVTKGGTGRTYLTPYGVMRGNGTDAVVTSSDFIYKDYTLTLGNQSSIWIKNTTQATSVSSGGALTIDGGAAINKNLIVGGGIDVRDTKIINVADPENGQDAVNKEYVDKLFNAVLGTANLFIASNDVRIPENVPDFTFASDVKAFVAYAYVEYNNRECAVFCLRGIKRESNWFLAKTFIGDPTNVDFYLTQLNDIGQIQYTNLNTVGAVSIRFRTITQIKDTEDDAQINVMLNNNQNIFEPITELTYDNTIHDAVQIVMYISNEFENKYGMYILNCVQRDNIWNINTYSSGNVQGLQFKIDSTGTSGVINYTNINTSGSYTLRIQQTKILKEQSAITLLANTYNTTIDNTYLTFDRSQYIFHILAYVEVPEYNQSALYEIDGLFCEGEWKLNTHYIGDRTGIVFSVETSTYGLLQYTNSNAVNARIKYVVESPLVIPLSVKKGGTGKAFLTPNAVLRGNGVDPVIASNDFIYENKILKLGNESSILLNNTSASISLSNGGALTVYGGASINKNLMIGEELIVNNIDITPCIGDLNQREYMALNNEVIEPIDITSFAFNNSSIKSFTAIVCVTIETNTETLDALYEIKGLKKGVNNWRLYPSYVGDDLGINFFITNIGQIQYTSPEFPNWNSTTMKFRAMTTTF